MDPESLPVTPAGRARLLVDRGLALYGRGDIGGAVRHWLAAREADPDNHRAHQYLAYVREHDGFDASDLPPLSPDVRVPPEPIGPPRSIPVPEYIPNPPAGGPPLEGKPPLPPDAPQDVQAGATEEAHAGAIEELFRELRARMDHDDFSGSLDVAERILERDPHNAEARGIYHVAANNLIRHLEAKLGDLHAVPAIQIPADEVIWLNLNHREGFVLSQVDGQMRYEDILDICGMPRLEALRILVHLVSDGVIGPA